MTCRSASAKSPTRTTWPCRCSRTAAWYAVPPPTSSATASPARRTTWCATTAWPSTCRAASSVAGISRKTASLSPSKSMAAWIATTANCCIAGHARDSGWRGVRARQQPLRRHIALLPHRGRTGLRQHHRQQLDHHHRAQRRARIRAADLRARGWPRGTGRRLLRRAERAKGVAGVWDRDRTEGRPSAAKQPPTRSKSALRTMPRACRNSVYRAESPLTFSFAPGRESLAFSIPTKAECRPASAQTRRRGVRRSTFPPHGPTRAGGVARAVSLAHLYRSPTR